MSKTNSATVASTVTAPTTFDGHSFAHGLIRDRKRGAAGLAAMKGAAILADALIAAGCERDEVAKAIADVCSAYRFTLTDKGASAHAEIVRLIAGV